MEPSNLAYKQYKVTNKYELEFMLQELKQPMVDISIQVRTLDNMNLFL